MATKTDGFRAFVINGDGWVLLLAYAVMAVAAVHGIWVGA